MKRYIVGALAISIAMAGMSVPAAAQSKVKPHPSFPDANGDGATELGDLIVLWEGRFSRMDKDKDGQLTEDERRSRETGEVRIIAADTDGDKKVSLEEIRAFAGKHFKRIDKNGDGKIDLSERRAELTKR